ncbi:PIN3 [Auxenochlorella protothecoides x Auxenochlorella symbiontica]
MAVQHRRVRHILLPGDQRELQERLFLDLQGGSADFAQLAADHSQCPSKGRGGDLGWISPGQTVPQFEEALQAASVGGGPAKCTTRFGLHILQVLDARDIAAVKQLPVDDFASLMQVEEAEDVQCIDVREEWEASIASIPGFQLFPLSRMEEWETKLTTILDPQKPTFCLCHHGIRSQRMAQLLVSKGFQEVYNIVGGIDAYCRTVDPSVPAY